MFRRFVSTPPLEERIGKVVVGIGKVVAQLQGALVRDDRSVELAGRAQRRGEIVVRRSIVRRQLDGPAVMRHRVRRPPVRLQRRAQILFRGGAVQC